MALMEKDSAKAREYLGKARTLDEKNPASYMMLASMDLAERNNEGALAEYDALLAHREGFVRALLAKAVVLDTMGKDEEAVVTYKEAIKSGDPAAYVAYSGSLRKTGDDEGALAIVNEGLSHSVYNTRLTQLKADILYTLKRFDEVLDMSNEIEKVNREAGLSLRTRTYVLMKEYDKAVAAARQMCDFNPKNPGRIRDPGQRQHERGPDRRLGQGPQRGRGQVRPRPVTVAGTRPLLLQPGRLPQGPDLSRLGHQER